MIAEGLYPGMSLQEYLDLPAVSQGPLRLIVDDCPLAAWYDSYLNPARERDYTRATDAGSVAHAILLEGSEACCAVIDPEDHPNDKGGGITAGWTNKAMRAARDQARAAGLIPMLPGDMNDIRAMVESARAFIDSLRIHQPDVWQAFQPDGGRRELTGVWQERGVPCRVRFDLISHDGTVQVDVKTTDRSANPARVAQHVFAMGYHVGAALYRRAARRLFGVRDSKHYHLFIESRAPHLCSLVALDSVGLAIADEKLDAGLDAWRACSETVAWPQYPARACYIEPPAYVVARWQEQQAQEELTA